MREDVRGKHFVRFGIAAMPHDGDFPIVATVARWRSRRRGRRDLFAASYSGAANHGSDRTLDRSLFLGPFTKVVATILAAMDNLPLEERGGTFRHRDGLPHGASGVMAGRLGAVEGFAVADCVRLATHRTITIFPQRMKCVAAKARVANGALIRKKGFLLELGIFWQFNLLGDFDQAINRFQVLVATASTTGFPPCGRNLPGGRNNQTTNNDLPETMFCLHADVSMGVVRIV